MLYDPKWEVKAPTKPLEPWRELLLAAADYMERYGHAKCSVLEMDGSVCLIGALSMVASGRSNAFLDEYLRKDRDFAKNTPMIQAFLKLSEYVEFPIQWNNDPNRSGREVISGMRECARETQL